MIEIIYNKHLTDFEKKYFMEAPDDEPRKSVTKTEDVVTSRTKQIDASNHDDVGDDIALDDSDLDIDDEDTGDADDTADDSEDVTDDNDDTPDDGDESDDTTEDNDEIATQGDDDDDSTDDTGDDTGDSGDGDDEIATQGDDDTDDSSENDSGDGGDDDEIATQGDDGDDSNSDGSDNSDNGDSNDDNSNDDDGIHKQNLYKKFMSLHESLSRYIDKLDAIVGTDDEMNHKLNEINAKFKSLKDLLYDYMILKFVKAEYVQSMLFYQRAIGATNLALDKLSQVWINKDEKALKSK